MTDSIAERLAALGIDLPDAPAPVATYVPFVTTGSLVFVSGQIPFVDGKPGYRGKLGAEWTTEEGVEAARNAALNVVAQLSAACSGNLDRVKRVVKITGFVNATPDFEQHPEVINGASNLLVEVFGEDKGRHARAAVGMGSLPRNVAVEVDAIAEIE